MKKTFLILIIICFLAADSAKAVSIKVKPPELKIETSADFVEKEITIENPGNNVALFEIYLDNSPDWVKIKPESFILEGGKSQKAILEVKNKETGVFSGMISVVAKPLSEREFKANAGVKIPLEVRVLEKKSVPWLASIFENFRVLFKNQLPLIYVFSIIFVLSFLTVSLLRKKKKNFEKK